MGIAAITTRNHMYNMALILKGLMTVKEPADQMEWERIIKNGIEKGVVSEAERLVLKTYCEYNRAELKKRFEF